MIPSDAHWLDLEPYGPPFEKQIADYAWSDNPSPHVVIEKRQMRQLVEDLDSKVMYGDLDGEPCVLITAWGGHIKVFAKPAPVSE